MLLSPTRTFAPVIKPALDQWGDRIRGIVHNTGGAHTKCLKYLPEPVRLVKDNLFTPPPIFGMMQEASGIGMQEMYQVFNMGTRLELYTDEQTAAEIIALSGSLGVDAQIVGRIEASAQKEVLLRAAGQEFLYTA